MKIQPSLKVTIEQREKRVLDFDVENRPLSYRGYDRTTSEVTAIAAQFVGEPAQYCWLLPLDDVGDMLSGFRELYDQADIVTGHYIRGHDLPIVNAAMVRNGFPMLSDKLTYDTCTGLPKLKDVPKSQEHFAAMLGVPSPKIGMTTLDWEDANRLTPDGVAKTRARVTGDVTQHIELLARLQERDLLGPPKLWTPYSRR